jgi:Tol biopolymer transport system component
MMSMKRMYEKKRKIEKSTFIFRRLLVAFIVLLFLGGCASDNQAEYRMKHPSAFKVYIALPDIASDNNTLLFPYFSVFESKLAIYNLSTGEIRKLDIPGIRHCTQPSYSRDGKQIVFTGSNDEWQGEKSFQIMNKNFYIINSDGTGLRQVSHFPVNKRKLGEPGKVKVCDDASFSPDGRKLIYRCADMQRKKAWPLEGTMFSWWDIYEMDISTGAERKLTDFAFYSMGSVYYLSDGRRFVFSGGGPLKLITASKDNENAANQYKENQIFIMDGVNHVYKPLFTYGSHADVCAITHDDTILFVSDLSKADGGTTGPPICDLFLRKTDGSIRRVTNIKNENYSAHISPDGSRIPFRKNNEWSSIWLINSDGSGLQEITIPMEKLETLKNNE